jgi:DNA-binding NarL/FixJ family response regulator
MSPRKIEINARRSRVLLVEDHPLIQEAVVKILSPIFDVVGVIARGKPLIATVRDLQPDVVVLDVALPDISGMQVLPKVRTLFPNLVIVVLTAKVERIYQEEAFARGADGFVAKGRAATDLIPAIQEALVTVSHAQLRLA